MSPDEIHELGVAEVARIKGEMRSLLDSNGYGRPIGEAMAALGKDPRFLYPNDEQGCAQALARYQHLIDQAMERCRDRRPSKGRESRSPRWPAKRPPIWG